MIIVYFLTGLILLILTVIIIGKIILSVQFRKEVNELFSQSKNISGKIFRIKEIVDLPEPVKRYFSHVLKDGQPYISSVRIKHEGQFKTGIDKDWIDIKGEQYASMEIPGFIWKGTTSMFVARDMYISGKGRLVVSLLSLYKIMDAKGENYNQGELLRWLGESVLYPTNLLPDERLEWFPLDDSSAKLTYKYNGLCLFFKITFNNSGEITEMETNRYMDEKNSETWVIEIGNYRELNNVIIPTSFEVIWRLEKGDFSYAKFNMIVVEYNKPEKF